MQHLEIVITIDDFNPKLNTQFTAEHFERIKKMYNKYKVLKSNCCVNCLPSEGRVCPYVDGSTCGKTAELLTGRKDLYGNGCFAVVAATYDWAKTQKFAKVVKI